MLFLDFTKSKFLILGMNTDNAPMFFNLYPFPMIFMQLWGIQ